MFANNSNFTILMLPNFPDIVSKICDHDSSEADINAASSGGAQYVGNGSVLFLLEVPISHFVFLDKISNLVHVLPCDGIGKSCRSH